jgi:hypothetical protein
MINGFLSESINIERGVKQGDALSCAIFIICIDPLLRNINKNERIKQVSIIKQGRPLGIDYKGAAYADDISVICRDDTSSIQQIFNEYERLTVRSGLELNADKTEILVLNSNRLKELRVGYLERNFEIITVNNIKICGLHFNSNPINEYSMNVENKIEKLRNQLRKWYNTYLTMEGKNLIVKTFGLSQLIYNMQVYAFKEKDIIIIERTIFNFLWSTSSVTKGVDRIKRSIMKNNYSNGGLMVTDVESLDKALKLRQFIRASTGNHPIAQIQAALSGNTVTQKCIKQEHCNVTNKEAICGSAQTTINLLIDYSRNSIYDNSTEIMEDMNVTNEVSSINLREYLKRKNKPFHLCILKSITNAGIDCLGELVRESEMEKDINMQKKMKIIISAFPSNLIAIASNTNEYTKFDEGLAFINLDKCTRKEISKITTRELQNLLKIVLGKVEMADFSMKLKTENFDITAIDTFRNQCKNVKLRSIYFRLIHNDFFTRERMKRFKMVEDDKCSRCGKQETTFHLLWECEHVQKIWSFFNKLMSNINNISESINNYSDIFKSNKEAATTIIKIKIIQELIQIERPMNWNWDTFKEKIVEIIKIEKYNAVGAKKLDKFDSKWTKITKNLKNT